MKLKRKAALCILTLLSMAGCGVQEPIAQIPPAQAAEVPAETAQALIAEGYVRVGENAYVMKGEQGAVSFYTYGTTGEQNLLAFLATAEDQGNTVQLGAQKVNTGQLRDTLTKFFQDAPAPTSGDATARPPLSALDEGCSKYYSTYDAGGTTTYAWAKGSVPASNCYRARLQVDAGYPRTSRVASHTNYGGSCSGNYCPGTAFSNTGYPQNGECYSGVYISLNSTVFSLTESFGTNFTC